MKFYIFLLKQNYPPWYLVVSCAPVTYGLMCMTIYSLLVGLFGWDKISICTFSLVIKTQNLEQCRVDITWFDKHYCIICFYFLSFNSSTCFLIWTCIFREKYSSLSCMYICHIPWNSFSWFEDQTYQTGQGFCYQDGAKYLQEARLWRNPMASNPLLMYRKR